MTGGNWTFRLAKNDELDGIAKAVVDAAYGHGGFVRVITGDKGKELGWMFHRAVIGAHQVAGENWIALDGERIVAHAGWFSLGHLFLDSPEQEAGGWNDFCAKLAPEVRDWWMNDFLPSWDTMCEKALGPGKKKGMWHLQMLSTHPEYQRKGIASGLVKYKEKQVAAEGQEMCLETGYGGGVSVTSQVNNTH